MRCGIDGSPLRLLLMTPTFALYTCTAAGHTHRTGAPPPTAPPKAERTPTRAAADKPLEACEYGACTQPKAPNVELCADHLALVRIRERERYVPKGRRKG